jgi:hypothetical protein
VERGSLEGVMAAARSEMTENPILSPVGHENRYLKSYEETVKHRELSWIPTTPCPPMFPKSS